MQGVRGSSPLSSTHISAGQAIEPASLEDLVADLGAILGAIHGAKGWMQAEDRGPQVAAAWGSRRIRSRHYRSLRADAWSYRRRGLLDLWVWAWWPSRSKIIKSSAGRPI